MNRSWLVKELQVLNLWWMTEQEIHYIHLNILRLNKVTRDVSQADHVYQTETSLMTHQTMSCYRLIGRK